MKSTEDYIVQPIPFSASAETQALINSMGATEDLCINSDYSQLAVAGFCDHKIYLFSLEIQLQKGVPKVSIDNPQVITSDCFNEPHGLKFIQDRYLLVGNRRGAVNLLKLPQRLEGVTEYKLDTILTLEGDKHLSVNSPGSLDCHRVKDDLYRVFVCNNYTNVVTCHEIQICEDICLKKQGALIKQGLDLPDGIAIDPRQEWVATSNHNTGTAQLHKLDTSLSPLTEPSCVLQGMVCPHGLNFSQNSQQLFVTDSATQYLNIYQKPKKRGWPATMKPCKTIKVMNEETYQKGRFNIQEGGVKAIDFDHANGVAILTSTHTGLKFYLLDDLLNAEALQVDEEIREKSRLRNEWLGRT